MNEIASRICSDISETKLFADEIKKYFKPGVRVGLKGQLGAGKTTFVKSLVAALGSGDEVTSPTYVLQHEYQTKDGYEVEHWDLYRLKSLPDELEESISGKNLILIEWFDRFPELMGFLNFVLEINILDKEKRIFQLFAA